MKLKRAFCISLVFVIMLFTACNKKGADIPVKGTNTITTTEDEVTSEMESTGETTIENQSATEEITALEETTTVDNSKNEETTAQKISDKTEKNTTPKATTAPKATTTAAQKATTSKVTTTEAPMEELIYYEYVPSGMLVDWVVDGDLIHMIFYGENRYVLLDTESMAIIADVELPDWAQEIHIIDGDLWISYPELMKIVIYDKNTLVEKGTLVFDSQVEAFDVMDNYIIYSNEYNKVFIYDMISGTQEGFIGSDGTNWFADADILIDEKENLVYIGDSLHSASRLYCFDITSRELKSMFEIDDYGYANGERRIILLDDYVYWGEFKLNSKDISQIIGQYDSDSMFNGMLYVDDDMVIMDSGIFDNKTYTQMAYTELGNELYAAAVTKSGHLMIAERYILYIFPDII